MADQDDELSGYFSIKEENATTLVTNTNQMYHVVAEVLRDSVSTTSPAEWQDGPVDTLTLYYVSLSTLRSFLNEVLLNPSKETIRLSKKHKIEGLLIRGEDLLLLNAKLLESEQVARTLETDHKLLISIH